MGDYRRPTEEGLHIMFIREESQTNKRFISCDGHQLYAFKERGEHLEVEGVRYIDVHRGPHVGTGPAPFKRWRSQTRGSQCVLVKIWRNTLNTYLVWRLSVVVR